MVIVGFFPDENTIIVICFRHCPSVLYLGYLPLEDCHAAIHDSFAIVNMSISEGMPAAVLEVRNLNGVI